MKLNISAFGEDLKFALTELADEFDFSVSLSDGLNLEVYKSDDLIVDKSAGKVSIGYPEYNLIFRGIFLALKEKSVVEKARKGEFGAMLDCSRNAVYAVSAVKKMIRYLAFMGYNTMQLYLEDTFKLENEPYFGYMRSGYSKEELKEIDAYAQKFGIEVVPCIQTLAHFNTIVRWAVYFLNIVDCNDILLADEEKTYVFIEKIFSSLSESLSSRKINIGMDEAHLVGSGKHLDIHGYEARFSILCRHLQRVLKIAEKYGYAPMMWGDMFFHLTSGNIKAELAEKIPENVKLVYWEYGQKDKAHYDGMLSAYKKLKNKIAFAGGAWMWNGYTPNNGHSLKALNAALDSVSEHKTEDIYITLWGDNGAEASPFSVLPCLYYAAEKLYNNNAGNTDFKALCGIDFQEFMHIDLPNILDGDFETLNNPSKYLLFNDLFRGIMDSTVGENDSKTYSRYADTLSETSNNKFDYLFSTQKCLSEILALKADLGIKTRAAYKNKDKKTLKKLLENSYYPLLNLYDNFYKAFKYQWCAEKKPGGFDIQDIRLGGLIMRAKACITVLEQFVRGEAESIEELEEKQIDYETGGGNFSKKPVRLNCYGIIVSANSLDSKT